MNAVRVSFAWLAIGCVAACGTFLSSSEDVVEPAPDAAVDVIAHDASADDANADGGGGDATNSCTTTTPKLSEDFATGDTAQWIYDTADCTQSESHLVDRGGGDNAIGLHCLAKAANGYAILHTPAILALGETATHVAFTFEIGSTETHTFAQLLTVYGGDGQNLSLVTTPTQIQLLHLVDGQVLTTWPAGDQSQWRTMELTLTPKIPGDPAIYSGDAVLDGVHRAFEIVRKPDAGSPSFVFQIGAFASLVLGDFDDAYDNVRIWSCP